MIEDGEVRPEGCICEPCSDIQRYTPLLLYSRITLQYNRR